MIPSTQNLEISEIEKGLNHIGLILSKTEINEIQKGRTISLESQCLSEIGSLFIIASAVCAVKSGKKMSSITLKDLPEASTYFPSCAGIPIYCWHSDYLGRCSLYLSLLNGKPGISICYDTSSNQ